MEPLLEGDPKGVSPLEDVLQPVSGERKKVERAGAPSSDYGVTPMSAPIACGTAPASTRFPSESPAPTDGPGLAQSVLARWSSCHPDAGRRRGSLLSDRLEAQGEKHLLHPAEVDRGKSGHKATSIC